MKCLKWMGPVVGLGMLLASGDAAALCVLMQDFTNTSDDVFESYTAQGFYAGNMTRALSLGDVELPVLSKVSAAGEPCYIFSTYQGLQDFVNQREEIERKLQAELAAIKDNKQYYFLKALVDRLPPVDPQEPLLIINNTHGSRCGGVSGGDILAFAKEMSANHPIALGSDACFSSDLLAKMLLDQEENQEQPYIDRFCLMTLAPFSHSHYATYSKDPKTSVVTDESLASFLKGMTPDQRGKSFAQYFRERNFYYDLDGQKRPLGICSAANWGEMGLVDYLWYGEPILKFQKRYDTNWDPRADGFSPYQVHRIVAAANLLNKVNDWLNAYYCGPAGDTQRQSDFEYFYFSINNVCHNLGEIRDAQVVMEREHYVRNKWEHNLSKDQLRAAKNDQDKKLSKIKEDTWKESNENLWDELCLKDYQLIYALNALQSDDPAEIAQYTQELLKRVAENVWLCDDIKCDMVYEQALKSLIELKNRTASTDELKKQIPGILNRAQEEMAHESFMAIIQQRLVKETKLKWTMEEFQKQLDETLAAQQIRPEDKKVNCVPDIEKALKKAIASEGRPLLSRQLAIRCDTLYHQITELKVNQWPKLRTDYEASDPYADKLAQIILGALDVNELDGLGYNGIPASSADHSRGYKMETDFYFSPARDLLHVFHNVMAEAMSRPAKDEFPLDQRRRQACENFKLGGVSSYSN